MIVSIISFSLISWHFKEKPDTTSVEVKVKTISRDGTVTIATKRKVFGSGEDLRDQKSTKSSNKGFKSKRTKLKLKAKQVLINEAPIIGDAPTGSSAVGELLNTIDSRDPAGLVRVRLVYDLKSNSRVVFKKHSILLGKATYIQGNDRVYVNFFTIISPQGEEKPIHAHALDSKDFSTGLVGKVHSNKTLKAVSSVALNVISVAAGVTSQRAMGTTGAQVPEFNAEDALLAGASSTAKDEANSKRSQIESDNDHLTVRAGKDLIVMLTKSTRGR